RRRAPWPPRRDRSRRRSRARRALPPAARTRAPPSRRCARAAAACDPPPAARTRCGTPRSPGPPGRGPAPPPSPCRPPSCAHAESPRWEASMTALSWRVGDVAITRVPEVVVEMPLAGLLPEATVASLARYRSWLEPHFVGPDATCQLSIHGLVVHADGLR